MISDSISRSHIVSALISFLIVSSAGCTFNHPVQINVPQMELDRLVSLKLLKDDFNDAQVQLANGSETTIFFVYEIVGNPARFESSQYGLTCKTEGTKDEDFSFHGDSSGPFRAVAPGESVYFRVRPTRNVNARCKMSVRYFTSARAIELLSKMFEKPTFDGFSDDEEHELESATQDISIDLQINYSK